MQPLQNEGPNLNDIFRILRRRKWSLIIPFMVILFITAAVALLLPALYRSTATILIEEQEIPTEFVKATVTSYAEERIEMIKQRIMTFSQLNDLMNRFNLYKELRDTWTTEQIVGRMRENILIEPVSAELRSPRTGRATNATIAFTLSYQGKDPEIVQQVTSTLTSLFLSENQQVRERQTKETSEFLEDEMNRVKAELAALDAKVARYKQEHINELPELLQANLQSQARIDWNIEQLNSQIRTLKEREGYLETQIATITPSFLDGDTKRLEELKTLIVNLQTRFTDEYPDIIWTRSEIADLEKKIAAKHKDTLATESDSPVYITLRAQLAASRSEMAALKGQIQDLWKKAEEYGRRVEMTPEVEKAYSALVNERNNTQAKYNDLMGKHMESQVAHGLEKERKGERFTLIDPARLPKKPFKPNRLAIMFIGFVLASFSGVAMMAVKEYSDQSVRDTRRLSAATPFPVLTAIPEIERREDITVKRLKTAIVCAAALVILTGAVTTFNFFVMNLNVFWAKFLTKFSHFFA